MCSFFTNLYLLLCKYLDGKVSCCLLGELRNDNLCSSVFRGGDESPKLKRTKFSTVFLPCHGSLPKSDLFLGNFIACRVPCEFLFLAHIHTYSRVRT